MSFSSVSTTTSDGRRHPLFKTRLCKHFSRGLCLYGDSCAFSHGENNSILGLPQPVVESALIAESEFISMTMFSSGEETRRSLVDEFSTQPSARPRTLSQAELMSVFGTI